MLCYKDKTFCNFTKCSKFNGCHRAFTDKVSRDSGSWWKAAGGKDDNAPVCFFVDKPSCFETEEIG